MAKSRTTKNEDNIHDYLVKPKAEFEKELDERIMKGEQLAKMQITTNEDLVRLKEEFSYWHDYNTELLSRAFNKVRNKYFEDYTWTSSGGIFISGMYDKPREPDFSEKVQSQREHVAKYVTRLKKIREKLALIDELPGLEKKDKKENNLHEVAVGNLENLFVKFHKIVQTFRVRRKNRPAVVVQDEYDVQYLLLPLLRLHFDDVREEDYTPSYAGSNSRIDFVLKREKIVVETKMTNSNLDDNEVGKQLLIDIGRYRTYPDCKMLVIFVYDKGDYILNKQALKTDLEKMSVADFSIRVFIEPR